MTIPDRPPGAPRAPGPAGAGVPRSWAPAPVAHVVGVDLAWGTRAATGLAVTDEHGRLLEVATVRTDEEILDRLRPWTRDSCLVTFDAPLVVPNETGRRACETLVSRYFGGYHAGAHSSNRSMPAFRPGPRAQRLAEELGLALDPAVAGPRRAVEVYPHPAIVTLFGLPKVLQYKSRSGRDVQHRRAQLRQLLAHLEGLRDAPVPFDVGSSARWAEIRSQVDGATRKVDLERVEDAVDAVVCAYVGLYAVAAPDRVRVLGDVERGYILTPVTPELAHRVDADRVSDQVSDQVREADRS